jgi:hypothetical protein
MIRGGLRGVKEWARACMMPHYKALARAGGRRKDQLLRLCRPMCGKALPFRYVLLLFLEAMPPIPEAQPR